MLPAALALLAAVAAGARLAYPRYLERRHSQRLAIGDDGIIVGAETIDLPRKDAPGILMLHGGGDTPQALKGLALYLHERGFAVRVPLFPGHGRSLAALSQTTAAQLREHAERELARMRASHEWVGIVGLSMGGALALKLAAGRDDVAALVLLAPYIAMPPRLRGLARSASAWGWLLPFFSSRGESSIRDRDAAARSLGRGVLTPAMLRALYEVVNDATEALPHVSAPTLVIQSRADNRIPAEDAEREFSRLGSRAKQFTWVNQGAHVITVDFGHQRVFELTGGWLEKHWRRPRVATRPSAATRQ